MIKSAFYTLIDKIWWLKDYAINIACLKEISSRKVYKNILYDKLKILIY